jgi:hypothetical protein
MTNMKRIYLQCLSIFLLLTVGSKMGAAQAHAPYRSHLSFEYGVQSPFGDLSERFGTNFKLGSQFELMRTKELIGLRHQFFYVREVFIQVSILERSLHWVKILIPASNFK